MNQGALLELPHADDSPASSKAEECTDLDMANLNIDAETAKRRSEVVEWLNYMIPDFNMSVEASAEELRARLVDGTVFCRILKRIIPASSEIVDGHCVTEEERLDNIGRFVSAVKKMGLPSFRVTDLQQGPVTAVVYCLWSLRDHLSWDYGEDKDSPRKFVGDPIERSKPLALNRPKTPKVLSVKNSQMEQHSVNSGENRINSFVDLRLKHVRQTNPVLSDPSTPRSHHSGHKFHELFQLKQGHYYELSAAKISEMMESNNLDNAPTQSLLSVINGILDENIERQNGEIPYRVACLLKKVVQEIERRISTQAEHIRNQNNLIKIREDKYHSRIRVLETLANTLNEETQMVMNQLQHLKTEKSIIEEKKKHAEEDVAKLRKEKENSDKIISELNQNLEAMKMSYNEQFHQLEKKERIAQMELEEKIKEAESLLEESRNRREEIEAISESKCQNWNKKENNFQCFINSYLRSVQGLRLSFDSIKLQIVDREKRWFEEFTNFGQKLKVLTDAAGNYHSVLEENRRLYNEVQELKGNIRVYCRIRPYLSGENKKQSTIYYIGENGELILANPTKQGKDGQRVFNFNKVFGPTATQEEVFLDTRPLIQSILDGYNVCIFAYGQTGSGKTYTMTGPDSSSETDWGVNYRALNDLFQISQTRIETFIYEVGVQMVEVYNEQIVFLSFHTLGIMTTSLPNGLAVPDASMHTVQSTLDVLELMGIGQTNRAVSATSLNERSSRSHSILTVHVQGMDLKTGATLRGSLHLVDLAGSERIERSEVIGERLKEAQHINKSLSALGDVIFALSQKNTHVPYRNSKLTQVLQSSLGGHAKTLMFVHINPDVGSYSETLSTLKFAERVSGVELGAARSQKEGKDVRDLMEQVTSLKDTIAKKDEEIEQLKLKAFISRSPSIKNERNSNNFLRYNSFSPARTSTLAGTMQHKQRTSTGKLLNNNNEAARKSENCSEIGDHFEYGSQKSVDDNKNQDTFMQLKHTGGISAQASADIELLGFGDEDAEEHLSDISDGVLSMGTETDGSLGSVVEFSLFPEQKKSSEAPKVKMPKIPASIPKPPPKKTAHSTAFLPKTNNALRPPTSLTMPRSRKSTSQVTMSSPARPPRRWQ
nr:PREDICTED: kinesin-4-like isoform X2 [Musa acuminata subsp. malaccensis]